jgi:3',5'-cyclic AMP phosphodiesterase CpdA
MDEVKTGVIPNAERYQRIDSLSHTLTALGEYLEELSVRLDAIIVSGDISDRGAPDGFLRLPSLLKNLGRARPKDPCRVVVLPGNHDIMRGTEPSSPERYRHFMRLVQSEGYTAPPIEGHTLRSDGRVTNPKDHYVMDASSGWLIIPINCAGWYGGYEAISKEFSASWRAVIQNLPAGNSDREVLEAGLEQLRFRDIARVSKSQFVALHRILKIATAEAGPAKDVLVRVAAIHHHLLPVTTVEEVKPFESLSNLGALRTFLAQQRIQVLVHGHKHSRFAYLDYIFPAGGLPSEHRLLVLAGETVRGNRVKDEIAQLITLRSGTHAPQLSLTTLPHCETAKDVADRPSEAFDLWTDPDVVGGLTIVRGHSLNETYDRVQSLFTSGKPETQITNLICEVEDGRTCAHLPSTYPSIPGNPDGSMRQQWLDAMVAWWQKDWHWSPDYPYFNHGGRIRRPLGTTTQWQRAIESLTGELRSSRGIVVLVTPEHDIAQPTRRKFPAFAMLQLLVSGSEQFPRLDIVAFFRKHEMKWWWPVNVAELHFLQAEAVHQLKATHPQMVAGRIVTVSAIAKVGETAPEVAIPLIDRLADEDPNMLFSLARACFDRVTDQSGRLAEWRRLIDDLRPPASMNADGVPAAIRGLEVLITHLERFAANSKRSQAVEHLVSHLQDVLERNRNYADLSSRNETNLRSHERWKQRVDNHLDAAMVAVRSLLRRR